MCTLALFASAARAVDTCDPGAVVRVDPEAWLRQLRASSTCARVSGLLSAIRLATELDCSDPDALVTVRAEGAPAQLSVEGRQVRVIRATVEGLPPNDPKLFAVVLVAVSPGAWCRVEIPSSGDLECGNIAVDLESVVAKRRKALHLTVVRESCAAIGCDRWSEEEQSWWEVRGVALAPLLSVTTWTSSFSPCRREGSQEQRTVTWSGGMPRVATISTEKTSCTFDPAQLEQPEGERADCQSETSKSSTVWRFDGTAYRQMAPDSRSPQVIGAGAASSGG